MRKHIFLLLPLTIFMVLIHFAAPGKTAHHQQPNITNPVAGGAREPRVLESSGVPHTLPWEADQDFLLAQQKTEATVLLGAYCTVLKDPLPGEESNVHLGARYLTGRVVKPGAVFSQNNAIGPYSTARGYGPGPFYSGYMVGKTVGGGVCKIASTLYNVAILSDLPVVERHAHGMPVPYVPLGQDATVCYGVKDFKFRNNYPWPVLIWARGIDNRLYIAFYGRQPPPRVVWNHEFLKRIKTYSLYRTNQKLPPGTRRTVSEGMDGAVVDSWVNVTYPDGKTKIRFLGRSWYSPLPRIIETGRQQY